MMGELRAAGGNGSVVKRAADPESSLQSSQAALVAQAPLARCRLCSGAARCIFSVGLERTAKNQSGCQMTNRGNMERCRLGFLFAVVLLQSTLALAGETKQDKIRRALSAAPAAGAAKVVDMDDQGKMTALREGTNGFTCFPGHPGVVGDVAMCADAPSMQWITDFMAHKPRPTNTQPGVIYRLAGGTDWSATDPFATSGTPIKEPPHWMIMWPFDPKSSGLPSTPKETGKWITYAGTPCMINRFPSRQGVSLHAR